MTSDSRTDRDRRFAILFGLLIFAIAVVLGAIAPVGDCGEVTTDQLVTALQFTTSDAEALALFGPVGSECRALLAERLRLPLAVDLFAFIPAFVLFMIFWHRAALVEGSNPLARFGVATALAAAPADVIETMIELTMTADEGRALGYDPMATTATTVKYVCIGLSLSTAGALLFARQRPLPIVIGMIVLAGGLAGFFAGLRLIPSGSVALIALAWLAMLGALFIRPPAGRDPAPDSRPSASP
ncbi:MAG: hypothetical protein WA906_02435 [Pacificimonas sp.]